MIPKSGAKFEEKLIFCFKNDKNLVNFNRSTKKSKKFAFWLVPFVHSIQRYLKKYRRVIFHDTEESEKSLENHRNLANFHQNTRKCQNWYFHGILSFKVETAWATNLQTSYKQWHWRMIKIWRRIDLSFQNWHKEFWRILTWELKSLQNLNFNVLLLTKVYNVWAKKVQRSYISWH